MPEQITYFLFALAALISLYGYVRYGMEVPKRTLRPRAATWLIWGVLSTCVTIIQLENGAALGVIGALLGAISGYVLAAMAWHYGHRKIHEADVISIILAFGVLIAWGFIGDTVTVVAASLVYLVGFTPTVVRAVKAPHNERMTPFVTSIIKYSLSIAILGHFSLETLIYPVILALANLFFVILLYIRRKQVPKSKLRQLLRGASGR